MLLMYINYAGNIIGFIGARLVSSHLLMLAFNMDDLHVFTRT